MPLTYLDHAATTPVRERAVAAMLPFLSEQFGNPSGAHAAARDARRVLTYDPHTGKPGKQPFLDHLPDLPEFLQFVPSPTT